MIVPGLSSERTPIEPSSQDFARGNSVPSPVQKKNHHKEPSSARGYSLQDFSLTQEYTSARGDSLRDLPGWFEDFTENLVGGRSTFTLRKRSSWSFGGISSSSSTHGSIMCSRIFQRTRIASLQTDQNHKGSAQKALKRSHTASRKVW